MRSSKARRCGAFAPRRRSRAKTSYALTSAVDRRMPVSEYPIFTGNTQVGIVAPLAEWSSMAKGAFAANTLRAWKADWEIFGAFCIKYRFQPLPAEPQTVREFVFECLANRKRPATIRRYVSTIGRAHRAANV